MLAFGRHGVCSVAKYAVLAAPILAPRAECDAKHRGGRGGGGRPHTTPLAADRRRVVAMAAHAIVTGGLVLSTYAAWWRMFESTATRLRVDVGANSSNSGYYTREVLVEVVALAPQSAVAAQARGVFLAYLEQPPGGADVARALGAELGRSRHALARVIRTRSSRSGRGYAASTTSASGRREWAVRQRLLDDLSANGIGTNNTSVYLRTTLAELRMRAKEARATRRREGARRTSLANFGSREATLVHVMASKWLARVVATRGDADTVFTRRLARYGFSPSMSEVAEVRRRRASAIDGRLTVATFNAGRSPKAIGLVIEAQPELDVILVQESLWVTSRNHLGLDASWCVAGAPRAGVRDGGGVAIVARQGLFVWRPLSALSCDDKEKCGAEWSAAIGVGVDGESRVAIVSIYLHPSFVTADETTLTRTFTALGTCVLELHDRVGERGVVLLGGDLNVELERPRPADRRCVAAWRRCVVEGLSERHLGVQRVSLDEPTRQLATLDYMFCVTARGGAASEWRANAAATVDSFSDHRLVSVSFTTPTSLAAAVHTAAAADRAEPNFGRLQRDKGLFALYAKRVDEWACDVRANRDPAEWPSLQTVNATLRRLALEVAGGRRAARRTGVSSGRAWDCDAVRAHVRSFRRAKAAVRRARRDGVATATINALLTQASEAEKAFRTTLASCKEAWRRDQFEAWSRDRSLGLRSAARWLACAARLSTRGVAFSASAMNDAWRGVLEVPPPASCDGERRATATDAAVANALRREAAEVADATLPRARVHAPHYTVDEVVVARLALPSHKASGLDGVSNDVLKRLPTAKRGAAPMAFDLVLTTALWRAFKTPLELGGFKLSEVAMIPKPPVTKELDHRPITLLPCIAKLLESVQSRRWRARWRFDSDGETYPREQSGFAPGRGVMEAVLALDTVSNAHYAAGIPLFVVYLDFRKAFDSMPFFVIVEQLLARPDVFTASECAYVRHWLQGHRRVLRVGADGRVVRGDAGLRVLTGVPQGSLIAPQLFVHGLQRFVECLREAGNDARVTDDTADRRRLLLVVNGVVVVTVLYADDVVLLANDVHIMQALLDATHRCASDVLGMSLSLAKCVWQSLGAPWPSSHAAPVFTLNGHVLERVDEFDYLGVRTVTSSRSCSGVVGRAFEHIDKAIGAVDRMRWLVDARRGLPAAIGLQLSGGVVRGGVLYAAELAAPPMGMVTRALRAAALAVTGAFKRANTNRLLGFVGSARAHVVVAERTLGFLLRLRASQHPFVQETATLAASLHHTRWRAQCAASFVVLGLARDVESGVRMAAVLLVPGNAAGAAVAWLVEGARAANSAARKFWSSASLILAPHSVASVWRCSDRGFSPIYSAYGLPCVLCGQHIGRCAETVLLCRNTTVTLIVLETVVECCALVDAPLADDYAYNWLTSMLAWPGAFPLGIVVEMVTRGAVPAECATDGRAHALVNGPRRHQRGVATKLVTALARGQRRLVALVDAVAARIRAGTAEPPPAAALLVRLPPAECPAQWDHDRLAENESFMNGEPPVSVARVQALRDRWPAWSATLIEAGTRVLD